MSFSDMIAAAKNTWFNTDFLGEVATLNGESVNICVIEQGNDEDDNSIYDFLDTAINSTDYSAATYKTDTLVYDGITWRYPRIKSTDQAAVHVRWISNQKPKATR